jgi:hypothetical protein
MTPEELGKGPVDETMRQRVHAIAQETYRRRLEQTHPGHPIDAPTVMMAIEIALSGWTPPEPVVDPDVLAFREWFAQRAGSATKSGILAGHWDSISDADAYLAGARMARERERERAKVLVEFVGGVTTLGSNDSISAIVGVARFTLAKYRGEA